MVGITLSPEQIQQAPAEVRRWIEQQVAGALGLSRPALIVEAEIVSARAAVHPVSPVPAVPEDGPASTFQAPYRITIPASSIAGAARQGAAA
jgi:hypothetical protein